MCEPDQRISAISTRKWGSSDILVTMTKDRYIIIALVAALIGVGLWANTLREKLNIYYNPFFEFEIEPSRDLLLTKWKSSGKIFSYAYDLNRDLADDSLIILGAIGACATIWVDEDFNGVYDHEYSINEEGRCIAQYLDPHQDGYFEVFIHLTADSVYEFIDTNEDGRFSNDELRSAEPRME